MDIRTDSTPTIVEDGAGAATNFVADRSSVNSLGERRFVERLTWFGPMNLFMVLGWTIPTAAVSTIFGLLYSAHLSESDANAAIGVTNVLGVLVGAIASVLAGTLSDRTRSRWGRRNPWILAGGVVMVLALFLLSVAPVAAVWPVVLAFCLFQLGLNTLAASYTALLPDRVATGLMGKASAFSGLGSLAGTAIGGIAASLLIKSFGVADAAASYRVLPWLMIVMVVFLLVKLPGADLRVLPHDEADPRGGVLTAIREFRLPRSRDYWLAYLGRFLTVVSIMLTLQTGTQIMRYYLNFTVEQAADLHALSGLVLAVFGAAASMVAGPLSDRLGRRKPLVVFSALVAGFAPLIYLVAPANPVLFCLTHSAVAALAFGIFQATDQALMVEVLPDPSTAARDLGFLSTTNTLSGVLAGAAGALLIGTIGFTALFIAALIAGICGAVVFSRLRSVA